MTPIEVMLNYLTIPSISLATVHGLEMGDGRASGGLDFAFAVFLPTFHLSFVLVDVFFARRWHVARFNACVALIDFRMARIFPV